jgi:hypothetical protein
MLTLRADSSRLRWPSASGRTICGAREQRSHALGQRRYTTGARLIGAFHRPTCSTAANAIALDQDRTHDVWNLWRRTAFWLELRLELFGERAKSSIVRHG